MNLEFENINLGATAGDKTGDGARTGGGKINRNFEKVKTFLETPDAILVQKTYALVGQDLTFAAGWVWRINTVEYTNPADVVLNFPLASAGKSRLDLVVLTTSNTFLRVAGAESTTTPVAPATPSGSLYVTVVLVDNTAVGQPQPPEVNGAYVQKSERANVILTGSGVINMLTLADEKATVVFKGSVTRLNTITYPNIPYNGKRITLFNAQNTPVTIGNSVSGYGVDFVFPNGQDYILQPNQTIEFSFDITYAPYAHHMFIGGAVATASGTLKTQKFIYTSGPQEFTTTEPIGEVVVVFRNGKGDIDFTNTTTKVTVTSPLLPDDEILVIYASGPVGISPYYTKAEMDTKYLLKADYNELEYLFVYRKDLDVSANMMLDSVGNNAFTDMGFYLDQNYILDKLIISFARFVNTAGLLIPVQLRVHQEASPTQPTPTTGQIIQEAECFAAPSNVFNKVFTFDLNFDLTDDTGTFLTVNTGNFSLAGATLADMLVVVKLKKKV